jgi:hypothetical protein
MSCPSAFLASVQTGFGPVLVPLLVLIAAASPGLTYTLSLTAADTPGNGMTPYPIRHPGGSSRIGDLNGPPRLPQPRYLTVERVPGHAKVHC